MHNPGRISEGLVDCEDAAVQISRSPAGLGQSVETTGDE